jgi:DnaJ-class molecular chaperone
MSPKEIHALARLLDTMDYYKLLRVSHGAGAAEIRNAFHEARRRMHPDAYLSAEPEVRDAVDSIARRITEAYTTLRTPARRNAYDEKLGEGQLRFVAETREAARETLEAELGNTPNGKKYFALAQEAERSGDVEKAVAQLKMALMFEAGNEPFKAKLAELKARVKPKKSSPHQIGRE